MSAQSTGDGMMVESARTFLARVGGVKRVRVLRSQWPDFDRAVWRELAGLGWLSILVPEEVGGLGLEPHDTMTFLDTIGAQLLPEPLVPALAAIDLITRCGAADGRLIESLLSGEYVCVPALHVASSGVRIAWDAAWADSFLIEDAGAAPGVRLLPRDTHGLVLEVEETVDGASLGKLRLDDVNGSDLPLLAGGDAAADALGRCRDLMRLGWSALLTGLMSGALDISLEYLKLRHQFGVPIGSFQALQHRAASMYVDLVASRALLHEAARAFNTRKQSFAAAAAKARASDAALRLTKEAIQFHGAIGYTDEHDIGLFLKRAMALGAAGGNGRQCRTDIATREPGEHF